MRVLVLALAAWAFSLATPALAQPVCSVGDKAQVLWKGAWYGARVQRVNEEQTKCYIRYDGYGSEWDEWVMGDRIKVVQSAAGGGAASTPVAGWRVGDDVMVYWKGQWYPASVIAASPGRWKIHYDGYAKSWDEWVDSGRIRGR
jgi:hypothetical protein